jgi:hypothetical protein
MASSRVDRLIGLWMSAALALCAAALVVVCGVEYDLAGNSFAITAAALGLALWTTASWPGAIARAARRLLPSMGLWDVLSGGAGPVGGPRGGAKGRRGGAGGKAESLAMSRLLSGAAAVAAAGGLAGTGGIFLAGAAARAGGGRFMWDPVGWAALRLLVEWAAMLPMGLGINLTVLVTTMARAGPGRDSWAGAAGENLLGLGIGLGAMGAAWWAGADPLGVALVACVALAAAGAARLQFPHAVQARRRAAGMVLAGPSRAPRLGVAAGLAGLTVAITAQMRIMRDAMSAGFGAQLVWAAASLALLAGLMARADKRARMPAPGAPIGGALQAHGAVLGVLAGLVLQCSLAIRCGAGGADAVLCGLISAGAQVPLAALGAAILSRQRRQFAHAGGRCRQYLAMAGAGLAAAMVLYQAAGGVTMLGGAGVSAAIAGMVLASVGLIRNARRPGQGVRWTACCGALILACGIAPAAALRGLGPVSAGQWLTAWAGDAAGAVRMSAGPARWRGGPVGAAAGELMALHPGRWWLVCAGPGDLPAELPRGVTASVALTDRSAAGPGGGERRKGMREMRGYVGDYIDELTRDRRQYEGVYLCPLSASHPEAWRCYSPAALALCRAKLAVGGVMALRTQVGRDGAEDALAVASSFERAFGGGWAVLATGPDGGLDMLLIGPSVPAGRPGPVVGVLVVPLAALLPPGQAVRPMGPWARPSGRSSVDALMRRLDPSRGQGP